MAHELKAVIRETLGTRACKRLRRQQQIPAVVYSEGKAGANLAIPAADWQKALAKGPRVMAGYWNNSAARPRTSISATTIPACWPAVSCRNGTSPT